MKKVFSLVLMVLITVSTFAVNYITVTDECPYIRFAGTTLQDIVVHKSNIKINRGSSFVSVMLLSGGSNTFTWTTAQARAYGYSLDSLYDHILDVAKIQCDSSGGGGVAGRYIDTIFRTTGKDSIIFTIGSTRYSIKDSTGGGGGDSIAVIRTYAQAKAEYDAKALTAGRQYLLTDFATIYDQSVSNITKTAAGEQLILTATSDSTFNPVVQSIEYPTDIIHYDITVDTTYINGAASKGKIKYRADDNGNSADFDWRKVLTFVVADSSEKLMFEDASVVSAVKLQNQSSIISTPYSTGLEFPNNYFNGGYVINVNNAIVVGNNITGGFQFISNCVVANTTVTAGGLSKIMDANLFQCTFGGSVDRLFGGYALFTTITGQTQYLLDASFMSSTIGGDARGISNVNFTSTTTDCNINTINGISVYELNVGFDSCTITTTTPGISFGNITLESKVSGKTITEALYPELFEMYYHKTIYRKPDGTVWYRFLDNTNVWVYTQIL